MKKTLFIIIIFGILLVGTIAWAEEAVTEDNGVFHINNPLKPGGKEIGTVEELIKAISGLLVIIAIPLATIMIILGGIQYLTSAGDKEKTTKAKDIIKWAIIGLAIILAVDFIIGFLQEILGKVNN